MNTKLTLRMDENLIAQTKNYAAEEGRSVSDQVSAYFARLTEVKATAHKKANPITDTLTGSLSPRRSSFYGLLADSKLDESDYCAYLEKKHL